MKDDYLNKLDSELTKIELESKNEVLTKYKKRYNFGLESGMSEDEIEAMLGTPEEIAAKYVKPNLLEVIPEKGFNLEVQTLGDSIVVRRSDDDKIHMSFEDTKEGLYKIKNAEGKGLVIDYHKSKYLKLNRSSGTIIVEIPYGIKFDSVVLKTLTGDIKSNVLISSKDIEISSPSGSVSLDDLRGDDIVLRTTSGEMSASNVDTKDLTLSLIQGSISLGSVIGNMIKVDNVSGDITIDETNAKYKVMSVTGKVKIGEMKPDTIKQKIKRVFISES